MTKDPDVTRICADYLNKAKMSTKHTKTLNPAEAKVKKANVEIGHHENVVFLSF